MSMHENLRQLAARDVAAAPFNFEVFEQRRAATVTRRRTAILSGVAAVAVLGLVSVVALLTQSSSVLRLEHSAPLAQADVVASTAAPALIELDQFDLTVALEDHIAALDDQLSAARVQAAPVERLQQLEATREQLNDSLQRVSYAHSLMSL
jgi:hypothetical protein